MSQLINETIEAFDLFSQGVLSEEDIYNGIQAGLISESLFDELAESFIYENTTKTLAKGAAIGATAAGAAAITKYANYVKNYKPNIKTISYHDSVATRMNASGIEKAKDTNDLMHHHEKMANYHKISADRASLEGNEKLANYHKNMSNYHNKEYNDSNELHNSDGFKHSNIDHEDKSIELKNLHQHMNKASKESGMDHHETIDNHQSIIDHIKDHAHEYGTAAAGAAAAGVAGYAAYKYLKNKFKKKN